MISLDTATTFFGVAVLLGLTPGPDNLFVLAQSAAAGARAGLAVVLGLCTGLVVHTVAVAMGLAAVMASAPLALQITQTLGAAYLLYLAWGAWQAARHPTPVLKAEGDPHPQGSDPCAKTSNAGRIGNESVDTNDESSPLSDRQRGSGGEVYAGPASAMADAACAKALSAGIRSPSQTARHHTAALWRRGVIMNLSNPKIVLFFLALLPQFVDTTRGPAAPQIVALGLLFVLATLLVFGGISYSAARVGDLLRQRPGVQAQLDRISALVFVALAARLVWTL